ncbi:hypothetical protein N9174_01345 [bacterium]|nr:hypothetical protein [bacterium]
MKIYSGGGDRGRTSLFSGERVLKSHLRIEATGDVDELNSVLGVLAAVLPNEDSGAMEEIRQIQSDLLHGVRTPSELYYESLFRTAAKGYVPCLTSVAKDAPVPESAFYGRVTQYLQKHLPSGAYDFYLCGRQDMIRDVTFLVDERFPWSFIYTEIFY